MADKQHLNPAILAQRDSGEAGAATTGVWIAPIGLGRCANRADAARALVDMKRAALELKDAEFKNLGVTVLECDTWLTNMIGYDQLSSEEAAQLTAFGASFQRGHDAAIAELRTALYAALSEWQKPPLTADHIVDLQETLHTLFVDDADEDLLAQATAAIDGTKKLVDKISKWVGRAAKAKSVIQAAAKLDDLNRHLKDFSGNLGEISELTGLARNVGVLAGALGDTPGGMDDVAQVRAGLDIVDFVISKSKVPLISTIWSDYIYKIADVCLKGISNIKHTIRNAERGTLLRWWSEQSMITAPSIAKAPVSALFREKHFPGGQPMLNFMWQLMQGDIGTVPDFVEDYFVEWRNQFNVGIAESEQLESDSSFGNLYNAFTRERAPNIRLWLLTNKESAWVKLYGGLTPPG